MPKITKRLQIYTLHILFFAICISRLSIDLYLNKQLLEIISWLVCCYCSQLLLVYIFSFLIFMNLEVYILSHQPSYLINMTYIELLIVDISCLENLIPFLFPALNPCFSSSIQFVSLKRELGYFLHKRLLSWCSNLKLTNDNCHTLPPPHP